MSLCAQRCAGGWLMRTAHSLDDDILGEVWLARNAGWLDGVGCERGGDDALAALVEADAHDIDERDTECKAVWIRAKACVGTALFCDGDESTLEEGLVILRQCADADDWVAALVLGTVLQQRVDLQQHGDDVMKHLEKAAALGSVAAMNNIGAAYENGIWAQKDRQKAVEWWSRAAERGECNASTSMYYLLRKDSDDFDPSKAYRSCAITAESGHPAALNNLGSCYENGIGVARNPEKAFSFYSQAYSLSHDSKIVTNLARCYTHGIGTKQDVMKGVQLFNEAIEMGDTNTMFYYGRLLWSGEVIERDKQKGLEVLKRAAELGSSDANLFLSFFEETFCVQAQGFQQDTVMPLFQKLFMTGFSYIRNESVKNPELGFEYIQRAVQECERVIGSDNSESMGIDSFEEVLLNFYSLALNILGTCYEEGTGVSKDEKEAVKCYQKGACLNPPFCALSLGLCYENGIGVECNKEKAFKLFKRASDLEDDDGVFHLGRCYENGIGVEVDKVKALELYCRASKLGNKGAKDRLRAFDKSMLSNELQSQSHP